MTVIRPTQPIPPPPDMSAEDLDHLATFGLGPRWRLVRAAVKHVDCPTCGLKAGGRCSPMGQTHNDRVWMYAARLRRERRRTTPEERATIATGLDTGDGTALHHAIDCGLLRLATGPDGRPHWVRTKALEDAAQPVDEVKSALLSAGMVDDVRVSSIGSPDIVQIEAGTGRRILLTVDGVRIQAAEVHVHHHVPAEEAKSAPSISQVGAQQRLWSAMSQAAAIHDGIIADPEELAAEVQRLTEERDRLAMDAAAQSGQIEYLRAESASLRAALNEIRAALGVVEDAPHEDAMAAIVALGQDSAAKTRASIVALVEAAAQHFQQQLDEDPLIPEGLIGEGFILRSERRVRLQAKASELRTIAAYIARGDDKNGGGT